MIDISLYARKKAKELNTIVTTIEVCEQRINENKNPDFYKALKTEAVENFIKEAERLIVAVEKSNTVTC